MDLPEITEAKRLTLRPGDSLAVRLDREPDEYEAHKIATRVQAITGVPVVVLGPSMDVEAIGPEAPAPDGVVRQAALEALLSTGFDPFNARAVLGIGPEAGGA
jgi:hypothetical protein